MNKLLHILRVAVIVLLLFAVGLPVAVYVTMSTPGVQNKVREIAVEELSKLLGSEVEIGKVDYRPFNTIAVHDVAVNDALG